MYRKGLTVSRIADLCGAVPQTVSRHIREQRKKYPDMVAAHVANRPANKPRPPGAGWHANVDALYAFHRAHGRYPTTSDPVPASLRKVGGGPGGLVFHSDGRAITRHTAGEAWRHVREAMPEVGKGWDELRHYHASQLISGGTSPVAVAHRLGHKDATETLKTYGHLWPDDDTRAAALTDGLVRLVAPSLPPEPATAA